MLLVTLVLNMLGLYDTLRERLKDSNILTLPIQFIFENMCVCKNLALFKTRIVTRIILILKTKRNLPYLCLVTLYCHL